MLTKILNITACLIAIVVIGLGDSANDTKAFGIAFFSIVIMFWLGFKKYK